MDNEPWPAGGESESRAVPDHMEPPERHSLAEDVEALYSNSKTYVEAEYAFQKNRFKYAGKKLRGGFAFALAALAFLHLALLGLTVGLVIALAPLVGPWGATAIVTIFFLIIGTILALQARKRFVNISGKFRKGDS